MNLDKRKGVKPMNLKNIALIGLFAGSYYFLYTLGTTNKIVTPSQEATTEAIKPELLSKLAIDILQETASKNDYLVFLKKEEVRIWETLKQDINISLTECNDIKEKWHTYYEKDSRELQDVNKNLPPLSQEIVAIVHAVMNDFSIDHNTITILPFEDYCPAAADDYSLFINESLFTLLTPAAQKFCIAHELQHFLNKDDSTNYVLLQHYTEEKENVPFDHPLNQISRLQELRADLGAALKNDEYALGFKEFIQTALEIVGDGPGTTHPKNSLRLSYADLLLTQKAALA